jgi:surfeit locus 1 family protein
MDWRVMFGRRWILTTLLVVAAVGVMVRLGMWQLDRLEQRRAFNNRVIAQIQAEPLDLEARVLQGGEIDLFAMEYRQVQVVGTYDHSHEIAIVNQALEGEWGVHLVTPLRIRGSDQVVLVNRGWIPIDDYRSGDWSAYHEPGQVVVSGVIRRSSSGPDFGPRTDPTPAPGEARRTGWNFVNLDLIQRQMGYPLLNGYIQQGPVDGQTGYPVRRLPEVEITEGSHMGYAVQWFFFAALLAGGYPFFVRKQEQTRTLEQDLKGEQAQAASVKE